MRNKIDKISSENKRINNQLKKLENRLNMRQVAPQTQAESGT